MKRYLYALRYLISIHVLGLILFTAFRLILFLQGYEYLMDEEISVFTRLEAFVRGLWLDNVVACYISILPLVIISVPGNPYLFLGLLCRGVRHIGCRYTLFRLLLQTHQRFHFQLVRLHRNDIGTYVRRVLLYRRIRLVSVSLFPFRLSLPNIITSDLSRYTKSICRKISLETRAAYTPLLDSSNRSMFIRHTRTHGIQPYQSKCSLLLQQYIFEPIGYKPLVQFIAQFVRGVQIGKSGN